MIDRNRLLDDLRKLVTKLEKDLRERCEENAEVDARVRLEYEQAKEAKRTAQAYKIWRDEWITQVAVAWVLGVVFVRFIEDNGLIATPFIAGPGQRLEFAKEQRTAFFTRKPTLSDREYLEHVFREVAKLPAMKELYDERHNPLWALGVSGDGAKLILEQFQKTDVTTAVLVHNFTDPAWGTRFLGDLYQDLSESARKKYALLQTPDFVEEFILDRTLDPAIAEFGLPEVRMIDPTCGSGHFLLGAFTRIFRLWEVREPGTNPIVLAQRALDSVYGVDLNPYAVAISRFRLLVAAMNATGITRLADAPAFEMNLAVGDALLHGQRFSATTGVQAQLDPATDPLRHVYATEDREELRRILGQQYHAVVGNPPYITVKDKALNEAYRQKYGSCHRQYSLSVPFMERFFDLGITRDGRSGGYVGQITADSFMKREFGAKIIQNYIPRWDLTHVIHTAGAHIPGHGTPTVILLGRNQNPVNDTVRAVMGIRGEPTAPDDPSRGVVWTAIKEQVDVPNSVSEWVSVADSPRASFHAHPWNVGGGGASELKQQLDESAETVLDEHVVSIGFASFTGQDDAFVATAIDFARSGVDAAFVKVFVQGDSVRDWRIDSDEAAFVPYDDHLAPIALDRDARWFRRLWPYRSSIQSVVSFGGQTRRELGEPWWTWYRWVPSKYKTPMFITFAEVSTHNHFVLDRGGKVFKQTAPVIKLPSEATDSEHLGLLGLLNSSTACFWLKQVGHCKGSGGIGGGIASEAWEKFYVINASTLSDFPIPRKRPLAKALHIDELARLFGKTLPAFLLSQFAPSAELIAGAADENLKLRRSLIAAQEELDWECYEIFDLTAHDLCSAGSPPPIELGERAFEIILARRASAGEVDTRWFERHGSFPITELPTHWPNDYRTLVERRIHEIETNPSIRLVEKPEYKRRWNIQPWHNELESVLRNWLLTRCEHAQHFNGDIVSVRAVAARVSDDPEFMRAAELNRGSRDFNVDAFVTQVAASEAVPALPTDRYRESGLRNRMVWEETWELQRREDRGDTLPEFVAPPRYKPSDYKAPSYWSLRGKLDVPKERFISFPGCERESDSSLPILWAGYDHLQQAKAIAAYYQDLKEKEGAGPAKLGKLLACILELLPWLKQWHNDVDPEYGTRMGDFFETFMLSEMSSLGLSMEDLRKIRGL